MLTLNQINREINVRWPGYELVKGDGYFYIDGPDTEKWYQTMIYVYRLNHLPLRHWIEAVENLFDQNR
jgi:hypothetical protein